MGGIPTFHQYVVLPDGKVLKVNDVEGYLKLHPEAKAVTENALIYQRLQKYFASGFTLEDFDKPDVNQQTAPVATAIDYHCEEPMTEGHGCVGGKMMDTCTACKGIGQGAKDRSKNCYLCSGCGVILSPCRKCEEETQAAGMEEVLRRR